MARYVMVCSICGREFMDQDIDDPEVHDCIEKPKPPKQTNADRIREMSDNELAEFLYETETQYSPCDLGIEDTWLEWLQQEVE